MHQTKPLATLAKLRCVMIRQRLFDLEHFDHLLHEINIIFIPLLDHYLHFCIVLILIESKQGFHRLFSQKPGIRGIHPRLRNSEKIHVTPFHLAILAQEKDVISLMLNSTLKYSENFRYSNHFQGK